MKSQRKIPFDILIKQIKTQSYIIIVNNIETKVRLLTQHFHL